MATRTFRTTLSLSIFDGGEHEVVLLITYRFEKAYPATAIDPGSDASAEIQSIRLISEDGAREFAVPQWMDNLIDADEALHDSLVANAQEDEVAAREYVAEQRRDDKMMGVL